MLSYFSPLLKFREDTLGTGSKPRPEPLGRFGTSHFTFSSWLASAAFVLLRTHAILGNNARAIEILEGLLSRPSWVAVEGLRVDPVWDPLRNDPHFQALLNKYGRKS